MTRFPRSDGLRRSEGLVLIEVMMAMVLLGLLLVPLVSGVQSIVGSADRIRSRSTGSSGSSYNSWGFEAWEWGEEVSDAWWRPGPILHVQARSGGDEDHVVGLWVDGWFLGEWESTEDGDVQVGAAAWTDVAGHELVARVRRVGGEWAPPWRLAVAAAEGEIGLSEVAGDGGAARHVVAETAGDVRERGRRCRCSVAGACSAQSLSVSQIGVGMSPGSPVWPPSVQPTPIANTPMTAHLMTSLCARQHSDALLVLHISAR